MAEDDIDVDIEDEAEYHACRVVVHYMTACVVLFTLLIGIYVLVG